MKMLVSISNTSWRFVALSSSKEWFSFKNRVLLDPAHPLIVTKIEDTTTNKKTRRNRHRRSRKAKTTSLIQEAQEVQEPTQEEQEPLTTSTARKSRNKESKNGVAQKSGATIKASISRTE
jgi:hypothetical protein